MKIKGNLELNNNITFGSGPRIITDEDIDPTTGGGFTAPIGSDLVNPTTGIKYHKFGATDLEWELSIAVVNYIEYSSDKTLTATELENYIGLNASSNSVTLTLPTALDSGQAVVRIKAIDIINTISVVRAGTDTIDGEVNFALDSKYKAITLVSDGVDAWYIY